NYDLRRTTSVDTAPATLTPMLATLFGGSAQNNTQRGLFAQGEFKFNDALTGVLGARYTKDEKDIIVCGAAATACGPRYQFNRGEWSDTTPRVGLNWRFDDNRFFYAYWAKGFRAGGFNGEAGTASAAGPFNPEEVKTIEIGAKLDLLDRRLRLNAAIFDTDAKDMQRQLARATSAGVAEIVTQNAAAASYRGAELELTWLATDDFRLEATLGYLDAKYTNYCTDLNGVAPNDPSLVNCAPPITTTTGVIQPVDLRRLPIARAPDLTARVAALYSVQVNDRGAVSLWLEWSHQGEQLTLDSGAPQGTTLGITNFDGSRIEPMRSATNVLNASVSWEPASERYRVSIYGKNLTDEIWFRRLSFASPLLSFGTLADPREYGIAFQYHFGK
ncbi:MAG: TonB-dependent receptor, partial [Steroidobacteraceae bacterium]|nr:TonB-dependent receptor [Steroidobacteraceae bacterium]MDW8260628.1 TonB-dependent receptor [Gammaproteobacteria bacterium]